MFNPGEATDSASSFLYTVLLAACDFVGLRDLPLVAVTLGIACAAATAGVLALACLERTRRPLLSIFLGVAISSNGLVSGWAISGMETLLFSFLVMLAVYRLFIRCAFGWPEALLVAMVVLTRFEGVLLAAAWAGLGVARFARGDAQQRKVLTAQGSAVAGILAAFLALKWALYGTLIPHAFALKRVTALYAPNSDALWDAWHSVAPFILLLGASGWFSLPRRVESLALAGYALMSVISVLIGPYADWARYSVHLLPMFGLFASVPLSRLMRELPVLALATCVLLGLETQASFKTVRADFQLGAGHAQCRAQVGRYLEQHVEPNTTVISSDIGAIAYAAPSVRFIDTVGLTSSDILAARARGESPEPILFAKNATIIADTCGGDCTQPQQFSASNWLVQESYWRTPLPQHEHYFDHLSQGNLLFRCQSPDGLWFGASRFVRH